MKKSSLPSGYEPFHELSVCGNSFVEGKIPIAVDGHAIFLLGKGDEVKVWLQIPTGKEWRYEIRPEEIADSAYRVGRHGDAISVYFGPHLIVRAQKINDEKIDIEHLDFTKFGLAIHGDTTTLWVGSHQFSGNSFNRVETMVSVG